MKKFFVSATSYEDSKFSPIATDIPRECIALQIKSQAGGSKAIGEALGSKVDRQLSYICNQDVPFHKWLDTKTPQAWNPRWRELKKDLHKVTKTVLRMFVQKQWSPVAGQVLCGDPALRLATNVDLLVSTASKKIILIELKCSGGLWTVRDSGKMRGPLSEVSDCAYNRYHLQLCLNRISFESMFPEVKVHAAVLLMAGDKALCTPLSPAIEKHRQAICDVLRENKFTKETVRRHKKKAQVREAIASALAASGLDAGKAVAAKAAQRVAKKRVKARPKPKSKSKGQKGQKGQKKK